MKRLLFSLAPTKYELIMYALVAVLLLSVGSLPAVVGRLTEGNLDQQAVFQFGGHQIDKFFTDTGTDSLGGALSLSVFWGSLGGLVYTAFWVAANFFVSLHNKYVYKTEYVHMPLVSHEHTLAHYSRLVLRASLVLMSLLYVLIFLRLLFVLGLKLVDVFLAQWPTLEALGNGLGAVVLIMVGLHIFTLLLRAFYLRPRLYE